MSQEQEDAAKWQMYQTYKGLLSKQAALLNKVQQWGTMFTSLSSVQQNPKAIVYQRQLLVEMPKREDILAAADELASLDQQITSLKHNLQQAGMNELT